MCQYDVPFRGARGECFIFTLEIFPLWISFKKTTLVLQRLLLLHFYCRIECLFIEYFNDNFLKSVIFAVLHSQSIPNRNKFQSLASFDIFTEQIHSSPPEKNLSAIDRKSPSKTKEK